jgi:hypothetical protein
MDSNRRQSNGNFVVRYILSEWMKCKKAVTTHWDIFGRCHSALNFGQEEITFES